MGEIYLDSPNKSRLVKSPSPYDIITSSPFLIGLSALSANEEVSSKSLMSSNSIDANLQAGVWIMCMICHVDERQQKSLYLLNFVLSDREYTKQGIIFAVWVIDYIPGGESSRANHECGPSQ